MDFAISGWIKEEKNKQKKTKKELVKSDGMKTRLSLFCTLKQNQLPLACLGVEGEGSAQKLCNYSALAQQQRAKGASKAFLWANSGSLWKMQPVCVWIALHGLLVLSRDTGGKRCVPVHKHFDYFMVQCRSLNQKAVSNILFVLFFHLRPILNLCSTLNFNTRCLLSHATFKIHWV